jgi:hypothetical protein
MDLSGSGQGPVAGSYHYNLYKNTLLERPEVFLVIWHT